MPRRLLILALMATACAAAGLTAQVYAPGYRNLKVGELPEQRTGFTFCRLQYRSVRREAGGLGYTTDYPMADENLMVRLSELTKSEVTWHVGTHLPANVVVRATDPAIFACPFLFASDVGTAGFSEAEVEGLRNYLLKGGFLWVDDFWGPAAWAHWTEEIRRVIDAEIVELPMDHPIFSTFYEVEEVPQIPSIQYWRGSGGGTSERGFRSRYPKIHGLFDPQGRLVVLMSHNTDIADGWEREGEDYQFFHLFSPRGYALGVNVAVWSMTH